MSTAYIMLECHIHYPCISHTLHFHMEIDNVIHSACMQNQKQIPFLVKNESKELIKFVKNTTEQIDWRESYWEGN